MQKILLFGTGNLYKQKEEYVRHNFDIVGYLDNNLEINGKGLCKNVERPMCRPENSVFLLNSDIKIVLMSYDYVSMWKQLYSLGVDKDRIIFGITFPPYTESETILFDKGRKFELESNCVFFCFETGKRIRIENHNQIYELEKKLLRETYRSKYPIINMIAHMDTKPVSRKFGLERGKAIDRYYIEQFLEKNKKIISGNCLEIAEDTYTLCYGEDRVRSIDVLHVEGWGNNSIKGNLETGEGIMADKYDCAIITQTLMFIFDIKKVAENIYKLLKKGGSALITVSGISQISHYDAELWGSFYSFHEDALKKLFIPLFGEENVKIQSYGNVKIACAMLCGLCQEDLENEDFNINDKEYPIIISIILTKE